MRPATSAGVPPELVCAEIVRAFSSAWSATITAVTARSVVPVPVSARTTISPVEPSTIENSPSATTASTSVKPPSSRAARGHGRRRTPNATRDMPAPSARPHQVMNRMRAGHPSRPALVMPIRAGSAGAPHNERGRGHPAGRAVRCFMG